jgi:hypothetical protein
VGTRSARMCTKAKAAIDTHVPTEAKTINAKEF